MSERTVIWRDKPWALGGADLKLGDRAPDFRAVDAANMLNTVRPLEESREKTILFSTVFSLDTGTCEQQSKRFNDEAAKLGDDVAIYIITMDLPFAAKRFCDGAKVDRVKVLSDYRWAEFAEKYGYLIQDIRMLQRGNVIVDRTGAVRYLERVPVVKDLPDFAATLEALKRARG